MISCLAVALLWAASFAPAIRPQTGTPAPAFNDGFSKAIAEFQAGNYASAVSLFERVEAGSPGTTDSLLYEAKAFIHLQNFPHAEQALRSYIRAHRNSSDALYLLGFVLHRQNQPAESLEAYTRAAAITPPTGDDLKVVGLNYVLLDDYTDAIKWLNKSVEFDPKNKNAWYYLGRAYYTKAQLPEARGAFLKVLELHPRDAKAQTNLGLVLETSGETDAALEAYRTAIAWQENGEEVSEQPYANLGSLLLDLGRAQESLPALEKAVAIAPRNAFCHLKLGVAYRQLGRLEDSEQQLTQATKLDPESAVAHYQLGRLYKDRHLLQQAQAEFDRTAELQNRAAKPKQNTRDH
jgi:tetratricopeptide (TPR) repeat protein